jgi:glycosyltransferase involved in cell wall biosynthesis
MVHQGAELYGSDRSFLSSVGAVYDMADNVVIDVVLPEKGPLSPEIESYASSIDYRPSGYLRKAHLRAKPVSSILGMFSEVFHYLKTLRQYDVVYVNTVVCFSVIFASAFFGVKLRKIVHVREIPKTSILRFFVVFLKLSRCEVIYNSSATKFAFKISGNVVLNGVPDFPNYSNIQPERNKRRLRVLIIGRINSWKGQDFFLQSIIEKRDQLDIRIVGSVFDGQDFYLSDLKKTVLDNALNVEFFSFNSEPYEHFIWSDYVVVPSKLPEPFGRVAIEAMAAFRPVIASAHGGLCEIIDDGEDGYLFKPNDANDLCRVIDKCLIKSPAKYSQMSIAARNKYEDKFSELVYKNRFISVLGLNK